MKKALFAMKGTILKTNTMTAVHKLLADYRKAGIVPSIVFTSPLEDEFKFDYDESVEHMKTHRMEEQKAFETFKQAYPNQKLPAGIEQQMGFDYLVNALSERHEESLRAVLPGLIRQLKVHQRDWIGYHEDRKKAVELCHPKVMEHQAQLDYNGLLERVADVWEGRTPFDLSLGYESLEQELQRNHRQIFVECIFPSLRRDKKSLAAQKEAFRDLTVHAEGMRHLLGSSRLVGAQAIRRKLLTLLETVVRSVPDPATIPSDCVQASLGLNDVTNMDLYERGLRSVTKYIFMSRVLPLVTLGVQSVGADFVYYWDTACRIGIDEDSQDRRRRLAREILCKEFVRKIDQATESVATMTERAILQLFDLVRAENVDEEERAAALELFKGLRNSLDVIQNFGANHVQGREHFADQGTAGRVAVAAAACCNTVDWDMIGKALKLSSTAKGGTPRAQASGMFGSLSSSASLAASVTQARFTPEKQKMLGLARTTSFKVTLDTSDEKCASLKNEVAGVYGYAGLVKGTVVFTNGKARLSWQEGHDHFVLQPRGESKCGDVVFMAPASKDNIFVPVVGKWSAARVEDDGFHVEKPVTLECVASLASDFEIRKHECIMRYRRQHITGQQVRMKFPEQQAFASAEVIEQIKILSIDNLFELMPKLTDLILRTVTSSINAEMKAVMKHTELSNECKSELRDLFLDNVEMAEALDKVSEADALCQDLKDAEDAARSIHAAVHSRHRKADVVN